MLNRTEVESQCRMTQVNDVVDKFCDLLKQKENSLSQNDSSYASENSAAVDNNKLAVVHLCSEISMKGQNISKKDFTAALDDLQTLIGYFISSLPEANRKAHWNTLRQIQGLLLASEDLFVHELSSSTSRRKIDGILASFDENDVVKNPAQYESLGSVFLQQHTALGYYTLQVRKRRLVNFDRAPREGSPIDASDFKMSFTPGRITKEPVSRLILRPTQVKLKNGTFSVPPQMSFQIMLPNSDEVFLIARYGKVEDLRKWVARNSRSIRVCDENGSSLLQVLSFMLLLYTPLRGFSDRLPSRSPLST
ncbi:hypothetical protein BGW36DRAFT_47530 [Talaromyces proteolyticus]|uniref:Uncharacterized protein n=1 Tax=Talaromyces proteolyticus TaxID=1131652 RepID=A0AAD4KGC9_9EURO|nr:uncharacterized protein BGW36DRAFT_47530 [Talaromyces proteolyticus]KAH8691120.1 hypothetical protein BGW36DRAFT_47530 [Talaromyces proteolyticus]